jgi:hypothetical protein
MNESVTSLQRLHNGEVTEIDFFCLTYDLDNKVHLKNALDIVHGCDFVDELDHEPKKETNI